MTECPICGRSSLGPSKFCRYHDAAHTELQEVFGQWQKAMGDISWNDYLESLLEADGTGVWVIEVIDYIKLEGNS